MSGGSTEFQITFLIAAYVTGTMERVRVTEVRLGFDLGAIPAQAAAHRNGHGRSGPSSRNRDFKKAKVRCEDPQFPDDEMTVHNARTAEAREMHRDSPKKKPGKAKRWGGSRLEAISRGRSEGALERVLNQRNEGRVAADPGAEPESAHPALSGRIRLPPECGAFERTRWPVYFCG
jgi:hypothetical protein